MSSHTPTSARVASQRRVLQLFVGVFTSVALLLLAGWWLLGATPTALAQSGPGGISNGLALWLDAADPTTLFSDTACTTAVTVDGSDVACWKDKSGQNANVIQPSGMGTPTYRTNQFNGQPTLQFVSSENDTLRYTLPSTTTTEYTLFVVFEQQGTPGDFDSFFSNGGSPTSDHFQITYRSGQYEWFNNTTAIDFEPFSNELKLYTVIGNSSGTTTYADNVQKNTDSTTDGRTFTQYRINENRNANAHANSKIPEAILYNRALTACELELVNRYLGSKYGRDFFNIASNFSLSGPITTDINGVGSFPSACGGRLDITSGVSGIATMSNPSSLDPNDYQTFAHDNAGYRTSSQLPSSFDGLRLLQRWRVDADNGDAGTVSINFDLNGLGLPAATTYALLVDADGDFSNATVVTGATVTGQQIRFDNVDFNNGDYFSLALGPRSGITVNTTDDELNGDGDCSLREAIQSANTNTAVDACLAGSGADTITLPAGVYPISIPGAGEDFNQTGDLDVRGDAAGLTIVGAGAATTIIDGGKLDRVLHSLTGPLTLQGVTVRNGQVSGSSQQGGGIRVNDQLTLTNVHVVSNTATGNDGGGVFAFTQATITGTLFQGNVGASGGGLVTQQTTLITNTQFISNSVTGDGGGVLFLSQSTISGSLFQENFAGGSGGGMWTQGAGTGLVDTRFISNTTGSQGGGLFSFSNINISVAGGQFQGNHAGDKGGGARIGGALTLTDSLFQHNSSNDSGGGLLAEGQATINDTQFISNTTATGYGGGLTALNPVVMSGSLFRENAAGNNGGGFYNSVDGTTLANTDFISNTSTAWGGGLYSNPHVTLTGGLFQGNAANGNGGGIAIGGITLTGTQFISNTATGSGGGVSAGGIASMAQAEFRGNRANGNGGGARVGGAFTLADSLFQSNHANGNGGAVLGEAATTLTNNQFLNNTAGSSGGGVYAGATLATGNSQFQNNSAPYAGGVFATGAATLNGASFLGNTCTAGGCANPGLYAATHVTLTQIVTSTDDLDVSGNWQHNGVLNQTAGKVVLRGGAAQVIAGTQPVNFRALEIRNSSVVGVLLGSNITVTDQLILSSDLTTTSAYRVNLTSAATTTGDGDVWGNTARAHGFNTGTSYAFGNPNVAINFASGTAPTDLLVTLSKAQPTAFPAAVTRSYVITPTGGAGYAATLRLRYKDAELNGNVESALGLFRYDGSQWISQDRSAQDTNANWVEKSGVSAFSPWAIGTIPRNLEVTVTGSGIGWVNSSPTGIACPSDCSEPLPTGTTITLTATPKFGASFDGWTGGGCSGAGACVLTISADTAVTATFSTSAALAVGNGKIAFNSNRDGNNEIYVMNPDGSGQTRLTNNPADDQAPAWSPDGSKIAFWRGSDLYVMNADGTGQTRVTTTAFKLGAPRWSPDGGRLVFSAIVSLATPNADVYTIHLDGTGRTQLTTSPAQDILPDWSPDGSEIVFIRNDNIYVMNADGTGQMLLVDLPQSIAGPRWSPDGQELTFAMAVGRNSWQIFRMKADGTGLPTQLTINSATNTNPGWSPDGRRIVFDSNIDGDFEIIHFAKTNGDDSIFPTNNSAADRNPDWQPIQVTTGELIVAKSAFGGSATFAFTSTITGSTNFNLAPAVNGEVRRVITDVTPSSYAIQEIVPAGWAQIAATCDNGDTPDNVTINAGDQVICVFSNVKLGSLTVVKNSVGGDGSFDFTSTITGSTSFSLTTSGGRAQRTFANLAQGSYAFTETVPTGWVQTDATCSGGNTPGNISLGLGQDITCTITNTRQANLTLIKNAAGGDATFPFTSTMPGAANFNLTTSGGVTQTLFANLPPGSYVISETVPSGWTFTGATCSDGSPLNAVNLSAGENVTCTVDNAKQDTIIVIKRSIGADASFPFTSTIAEAASFNLSTVNGEASRSFTGLNAGAYSIVETALSGWEQSVADPVCSNGDPASAITLDAGETVVCVFVNLQDDTIAVEKRTIGGDGTFAFSSNIPGNANFSLTTSSGVTLTVFSGLNPAGGSYSITETVPSGWELSGASCDNGDTPGSIILAPGAKTTCVFTNTKQANLTLVKFADGGDGSFGFTSDIPGNASFSLTTSGGVTGTTFSNLSPATYVITETTPADWVLTFAVCDNGDDPSNGVTLAPGANVTCLYLNQARATLTVVKQADGGDATFPFTSTIAGAANFNLITSGGVTQTVFSNVAPGTYSLAEVTPTGWAQSRAFCDNGNDPASLLLLPGSDVTCTFVNGKEGSLTIVKQADPNDGTPFVFGQDIDNSGAFTLTHAMSTTFSSVAPGSYTLSETLPTGWHLSLVNCQAASGNPVRTGVNYVDAEFSVVLAPGEDVSCTVENHLYASLTIDKVTSGGDDTFNFTSPFFPSSTFSLTTVLGIDSVTFDDLPSNLTYTLLEDATPGWALTSAICDNGDTPDAVFLAAGDDVTCTFSNATVGSITIVKQANPDIGTLFGFDQDIDGSGAFTLTHALSTTFTSVAPGSYNISETLPAGWYLGLVNCQAASGNNVTTRIDYPNARFGLDLLPGEDVTCTVSNDLYARLTIVKQADGGDATFDFSSPFFPSSTFSLTTVSGSAQITFDQLPGNITYELNEDATPGWALTDARCDNGDTPDALFLAPGDNVTCTFRNGKVGSITVVKQANPADSTPFDFALVGNTGQVNFTLQLPSVPTYTLSALAPSVYSLAELTPLAGGWNPAGVICRSVLGASTYLIGDQSVNISLASGDDVVCTFLNQKNGSITVVKDADPADDTSFGFRLLGITQTVEFGLQVPSAPSYTVSDLEPGFFYDIYELVPFGWNPDGITCQSSLSTSSYIIGADKATVELGSGDDVTCSFRNRKEGSITIAKDADPADDTPFNFALVGTTGQVAFTLQVPSDPTHTVSGLQPDVYAVAELLPGVSDWDVKGIVCQSTLGTSSYLTGNQSVNIDLAPGDDVTCTFANEKRGSITIVKDANPANDTAFDFTITGGVTDTFTLRDPSVISKTYSSLLRGDYEVTELLPASWRLDNIQCQSGPNSFVGINYGNNRAYISLAAGDNIVCTFANEALGSITMVKDANPANDTAFDFAITGPISDTVTLRDPSANSKTYSALRGGDYELTELLPAGWRLDNIQCQHGPNSSVGINYGANRAFISLAAGDNIVCTFENSKLGTIIIGKRTTPVDIRPMFEFTQTIDPAAGNFTINHGSASTFLDVTPGQYTVTEANLPAGWQLSGLTCDDANSTVNPATGTATINLEVGETVRCAFENRKLDTLVVVKRAVGGDGTFNFSSPQLGAFNLKTLKGEQQTSFTNLTPGTYSIAESVPAGWTASVADPVCSNGDNASNISIDAGETVVCVFVNLKQDTITVEKRTVGGDGTFAFNSPQLGAFSLNTTGGSATQSFTGLNSGAYSVSETVPAGWVQSGATCSDGSNPANISLAPGASVSCVFTNTKLSSITLVKQTVGGDGTFAFTGDLGAVSLTTTGGSARQTFGNLAAGSYAISETAQAGWDLTRATCSDGSLLSAIDLAPGEDVTCTFVNTKRGSLTVVKNSVGGDGAFTVASQALGPIVLTTTNGTASQSFANLVPGSYDLAETIPAGWRLTGAVCSDGSPVSAVNLTAGEAVTCTFTNEKLDTIVVVKRAVGGDGAFAFTSTITGSTSFTLTTVNGAAQQSFTGLPAGTYDVSETSMPGWTPTVADPVCSNGDRASNITLGAGETVVCVFVNLKQDTLIIEKQTVGGDGAFAFTSNVPGAASFALTTTNGVASQSFTGLPSTTYTISESVPAGWVQTSATCDNGDTPDSVSLAPGATVKCTFTNTKLGKIEILKRTVGDGGSFAFSGDLGSFSIKTASGAGKRSFSDLAAGVYAVAETVPVGWDLTSATCSDGSSPAAIALAAGEEVICVFENTKQGSITLVKQSVGGDGSFAFSSQALGGFTVTTTSGAGQQLFANLAPGSYDLSENAAAGWDQTSASCSDGSNPASVNVGAGENVTCTFVNTKRGSITIVKNTVGGDASFAFTGDLGGFSLTTSGGTVQRRFDNLAPGVYGVDETALANWDKTSGVCSNGSSVNAINLGAGENVTCTFTNTRRGSLTVVKESAGDDGVFTFGGDLGSFVITTTNGLGQQVMTGIVSGTYSISESVPAGWNLAGASCSNGSPVSGVQISNNEDVTCTFRNEKQDTIVVVKRAVGGDDNFNFNSPALGNFSLSTTNGTVQRVFSGLQPGSYSITETVPAGWTASVADPLCSNGDRASNIQLDAGETAVCVFVNLKQNTLVVEKKTLGGDGSFAFSSPQLGSFALATTGGSATRSFTGLQAGTYSISESVPAGWTQTGVSCDNGASPSNLSLAPGATVTCVFTNTKLSGITVIKRTLGGDATFDFGGDLGSFSLKTAGGLVKKSFNNLAAATYAISETVPAGWDLTSATCSDGSDPASVDLAAGENVTCTFVNTKRGSLTVVKQATGGDAAFDFSSNSLTPSNFSLTTVNGAAQQTFANLVPGVYDVAEAATTGWRQDGVTCSDGSSAGSIDIGPGEDVTCTFANTKLDTIIVQVLTLGGDDTFPFTSSTLTPSSFSLTTVNGVAQQSFTNLSAGVYDVTQNTPSDWVLDGAACSDGSDPAAIDLAAGESVVCVFLNRKPNTIVVEKNSIGGDGTFAFTGDLGSFTLSTSNGVTRTAFSGLQPGTFSISETVASGWDLASASCDNGDDPGSVSLLVGETVTCRFENTQRGSLTVVKNSTGGDGSFAFTGDLGSFTLSTSGGTAQQLFVDLRPGTYAINETVPTGWDLTSAICSDGSLLSAIDIAPGEDVTCTVENTKRGGLTVVKRSVGADGIFNFGSQTLGNFSLSTSGGAAQRSFVGLVPGVYDLSETVPAGWDLTSATCSDGSNPASVNVGPGETVTCTFTNTKRGSITVVKDAVGGDAAFAFSGDLGSFNLTTAGSTAQRTFPNLVPGVYGVSETTATGWDMTGAVCSDGSTPNSINLGAGEDVTCTFVNTKRGSLTVVKNATGGDDAFSFSSTALGGFVITTTTGTGQQTFANLVPGSYDLAETVPAGWTLTAVICSDGSDPANVTIGAGEDVTCTFDNLKQDTIVVVKRAVGGDGTFAFNSPQLSGFSLSTVKGKAQQSFSGLLPGSYSITETVPAGWTAQDVDPLCSNGQRASSLTLAAGQSIVCEFVNLKNDTLVVEKRTVGGDGSFAFSSPQLGDFGLATSGGSASRSFTGLQAGTYALSESVPAGWTQTGATCSDGSNPNSISLAPGATVTCVFTNTKLSGITVIKRTIGGNGSFDFSGDLGSFSLKTAGASAKKSFRDLTAGTYAITETVPAGWELTSATCSDGSDPASVDLATGENVTCIFVNTKRGSLTVVKQASGGDAAFSFSSNSLTPSNFSLTTVNGAAQRTFTDLVPGVYDVAEAATTGWRQDGVTCSDGSSAGSINIAPGENVTCTFVNAKLDTITVIKRTVGGDGSFDFGGDLGSFSLTTVNGTAQQSFDSLNPGAYSISETVPVGWTLQDADPVCSNGDRAGSITLAAGESVVCEFVNLKNDTVIIEKRTVGGDGSFAFVSNLPGGSAFSLTTSNGVTRTAFSGLQPGTFSISETVASGWDLTSASCDNGSTPDNLILGNGETVTCTFINTQRGRLTVVKDAVGGDDTFDFTSPQLGNFSLKTANGTAKQDFFDLLPGSYAISETVPAGWDLTSVICNDGSSPDAIVIGAGEDVTCTVENTKRGSLTVVKQATGGDGVFNFSSGALGSFAITTTAGAGQQTFANLVPGVYGVSETVSSGWQLVGTICSNGDAPTTISLEAGEAVTCTFENTLRPTALYLPLILKEEPPQPTDLYLPFIVKDTPQPQTIYSNNFTQGVGSEWTSGARTGVAPNGETFLGELGKITATLSLTGLPAHQQVTVAFDLYIMRSWDGNQESVPDGVALYDVLEAAAIDGRVGPDYWLFKQGEQILLETTFANNEGFRQSYPDPAGVGDHPRQTGASAVNTLGYTFADIPMDATYRIEKTFSHVADTLDLNFRGVGLQAVDDESWGIDNITVIVK